MKKILLTLALLILALAAGTAYADDYVIGKGDVLSILVWGEDSLSADVLVRPDGKISVPGVGDVQADGTTPQQLRKMIASRLTALVNDPMVTVLVRSPLNNSITVHGGGIKSGQIPLSSKTTLLQLLTTLAPDQSADLDNAYLARDDKVLVTGLRELFEKGDMTKNIELAPGDRLFIPLRENCFIYVDGAVNRPATLPYRAGITLLEAVHLAGGFSKFADRNDTTVVRNAATGKETINVKAGDLIDDGDISQNIALQPGDIILVKKGWF